MMEEFCWVLQFLKRTVCWDQSRFEAGNWKEWVTFRKCLEIVPVFVSCLLFCDSWCGSTCLNNLKFFLFERYSVYVWFLDDQRDSTPGRLQSFDLCRKHASLTETRPSFSDEPVTLWYPNEEREGHPKRLCCHRGYVLEDHSTECFYTYMLEDPMSCHLRVCHELQDIPGSWNRTVWTVWSGFIQWSSSMYHPLRVLYESTQQLPIDLLEQFKWSIFHQRFQIQKALSVSREPVTKRVVSLIPDA